MPLVPPSVTGAAPGKMNKPPGANFLDATAAAIEDVQTDCLNAKSTFDMKSSEAQFPPHQPPATFITA